MTNIIPFPAPKPAGLTLYIASVGDYEDSSFSEEIARRALGDALADEGVQLAGTETVEEMIDRAAAHGLQAAFERQQVRA